MTDKYINAFVDIALQAKDRALDLSVQARQQAVQLNDRVSDATNGHVTGPKIFGGLHAVSTVVGALSLLTYLVPTFYHKIAHRPQDLVKKYSAKWALVTGGSSGIGLALVEKLAKQGANVVIVAYPDSAFEKNLQMLKTKYPSIIFRDVPVDLSKQGEYMPKIISATNDLDIQIIFNNAGYIKTGFFCDGPLQGQLANHTCNATAALEVTHHFVALMQKKKLRGCVGYTSSPAGFTPCPFSVVYGATKAYLTEFAASIAAELRPDGIDVCVVHPSPVASRFYEGTHALGVLLFFKGTATGPETIANCLFASMGRTVIRDQGYYPTVAKILLKMFDFNLFTDLTTASAKFMPEFKTLRGVQAPPRAV